MITEFGKFLRILRITRQEPARELAAKFGVTVSYLSAVETGKRSIPPMWEKIIIDEYNLSTEEKRQLYTAIEKSTGSLSIDLSNFDDKKKQLLFAVARGEIDDSLVEELCEVIRKDKN